MSKPHWQKQHEWWDEDFKFEIDIKQRFVGMLKKHPDDSVGRHLRDLINMQERTIQQLKKEYKKIYGVMPKIRKD